MLTIVGQGLAGTLAGFEAERRGRAFRMVDQGSGAPASRAAAGLFNPLIGPRFTSDGPGWDRLVPFYRDLEQTLGTALVHPLDLVRPLEGTLASASSFPRSEPGWSARVVGDEVLVQGGGWVDLSALLDAARERWRQKGLLEERDFGEGRGESVLWCGGIRDMFGPQWGSIPAVHERQAVRGDVLTVRIPGLGLTHAEVSSFFLLPLGQDRYRWGATHERGVMDQDFRPEARARLEEGLRSRLQGRAYEVLDHRWGVRPSTRQRTPLVVVHPDEPGWTMFNGFGGRGVALVPRWLDRLTLP